MKKTILAALAVILLLIAMPMTFSTYEIPNWYAVEGWEVETCSKWGGTAEAQTGSATSEIYLSQLTVALQAEKTAFPDNTTLYEVSYYIQPMTNNVEFSVWLKNTLTGDKNNITQTASASPLTGASGFNAFYSNISYDVIQLGYIESPDSLMQIINVSIISTQPPITPQICTDSDGGKNYYTFGNATGVDYTGGVNTINDGCIIGGLNDGWLREAVCEGNVATWSDYNCSNGCSNGACINATPTLTCSDGTSYSQCSSTQPTYCENGNLINKCSSCSCPSGQSCQADESCISPTQTCTDGTSYNQCSVTKPLFCNNGNLANKCSICVCPSGQTCQNDESCVGADTEPPAITDIQISSASGLAGTIFTITAKVADSSGVSLVNAYIQNPDETNIATVSLYDDGTHGEGTANDGIYGNIWDSTGAAEVQYYIDITAQDKASNNAEADNAASVNVLAASLCKTVVENGDHESKIDVVFLANGYSEEQLLTFASTDVPSNSETILFYEPFSQNRQKFNIYYVDKAYDTSCYDFGNADCENDAFELASLCPFYDQIIVLTNYPHRSWAQYSGLAISQADGPKTTTHEFGHSFGGLADEYSEEGRASAKDRPNCDIAGCPKWCDGAGANCIAGAGCYKGCTIYEDYRSSENSLMNSEYTANEFNVVSINHMNKIFKCCYPSSQEEYASVDCAGWNVDNSLRYSGCLPIEQTYLFELEDLSEVGFDITTNAGQAGGITTMNDQEIYYYYTFTPEVSIDVRHGELAKDGYEYEVSRWNSKYIMGRDEYGDNSLRVNYESGVSYRGELYILKSQTYIHFYYSGTDEEKIKKLAEIGVVRVQ
ncbi:hypothetical protein HYU07_01115 [Candidatus Woesearchaeota archaeon]|nr:hypothetical protein [Candidatus Woesearchaeota archaeon]